MALHLEPAAFRREHVGLIQVSRSVASRLRVEFVHVSQVSLTLTSEHIGRSPIQVQK
jgi:hypothetical protein